MLRSAHRFTNRYINRSSAANRHSFLSTAEETNRVSLTQQICTPYSTQCSGNYSRSYYTYNNSCNNTYINGRTYSAAASDLQTIRKVYQQYHRELSTATANKMSVEETIRERITKEFSPIHLEIVNESYKHNVPKGSESHFKVFIVSKGFEGTSLVAQHRMVNHCLGEELKKSIHALSIQTKTPAQWEKGAALQSTPNCLGGDQ